MRRFKSRRARRRDPVSANPIYVTDVDHLTNTVELTTTGDSGSWQATNVGTDLIVLATHGRRGLKHFLMGSVSEKVVRTAGCPVMVLREKSHAAKG